MFYTNFPAQGMHVIFHTQEAKQRGTRTDESQSRAPQRAAEAAYMSMSSRPASEGQLQTPRISSHTQLNNF